MCLLAELYLCTSQPDRTIAIINNLEKILFSKKEGEEPSSDNTLTEKQIENWKLKLASVIPTLFCNHIICVAVILRYVIIAIVLIVYKGGSNNH